MPTEERTRRRGPLAVRGLLIVARDQGDLYDYFRDTYGDRAEVTVLVDRRQGERRRAPRPVQGERRRRDRRTLPSRAEDLRVHPYVLVRPHARRPRG